ncbi:MAG: hypothetical protein GX804_03275 [Lentisphaerae bacterium]|nr:hypothetical protein [Lentisphaerota bacterium]
MKQKITISFLMMFCFAALAILFYSGCESADSNSIEITPSYAELRVGQSATFHATGAQYFSWSLKDPTMGSLSSTSGEYVVYTARNREGNSSLRFQEISVNAAGSSSTETVSPSGTNDVTTTVSSGAAKATVKHL